MIFEKAAYWIAVGVVALFLSNNFAARHRDDVRCFADRSLAAVEQVSGHAARFVGMAEMVLGRSEIRFVRAQTTLAGAQTRLASVESVIACREAALARVEAEHARMTAMQQMRATVVCPRQNLRMAVAQPLRDGTI